MWSVLKREPLVAYGGFYVEKDADDFARRKGGQVLKLDHKHGCYVIPEGCDHLGAVWFNGNWERPIAEWPSFDLADAQARSALRSRHPSRGCERWPTHSPWLSH